MFLSGGKDPSASVELRVLKQLCVYRHVAVALEEIETCHRMKPRQRDDRRGLFTAPKLLPCVKLYSLVQNCLMNIRQFYMGRLEA